MIRNGSPTAPLHRATFSLCHWT